MGRGPVYTDAAAISLPTRHNVTPASKDQAEETGRELRSVVGYQNKINSFFPGSLGMQSPKSMIRLAVTNRSHPIKALPNGSFDDLLWVDKVRGESTLELSMD